VARTLESLGWDAFFADQATDDEPDLFHARVVAEHRGAYRIVGGARPEMWATVSGRARRSAGGARGMPAVGDWVAVRMPPAGERAAIQHVLRRRSAFARKAAGQDAAQVVAANIDVVFVVTSLNRDVNPRRLERYLTLAWNSGAAPVVVLSKADLCPDVDAVAAQVARVALALPVHVVSARTGSGVDALRAYLGHGRTAVLLGSSGVGKSTLVNVLGGRAVQEVRDTLADDRGVHTTTARQLLFLPDGGMVIDTPGIREVGLVGDGEGLERAFADVAEVVAACRFSDCRHEAGPDCAVTAALESGTLPSERWQSYLKLQREIAFQATREDPQPARDAKSGRKQIHRELRAPYKSRRR
jgi:ribosome biogenesis GTPase